MIDVHVTMFAGKAVKEWTDGDGIDPRTAVRLSVEYDSETSIDERLASLVETEGASRIEALVIGQWSGDQVETDSVELIEALVEHAPALPSLQAIFIGDITYEECEISWLHQSDVSPLLAAYPKLQVLWVRGGDGLELKSPHHATLRELVIQTGGLSRSVVQSLAKARLPSLEHLELWLGSDNYGADTELADLEPFFLGELFPKLKYLGLCDSELADSIAAAIAKAPVLKQLETLDLSMGTLGDDGGQALLASPAISRLKKLDLHHHYLSEALAAQLSELPGVEVDLSGAEGPAAPDERYISVAE
jgi:hypothetical protein